MFARFIRSPEAQGRGPTVAVLVGVGLLLGWSGWFFFSRVAVYEVSRSGRLEVAASSYSVDAPVSGRVVRSQLALDQVVKAGDVLVELDGSALAIELASEQGHAQALEPQIAALRRELGEDVKAVQGDEQVATAALSEAAARRVASRSLADLKETEDSQLEELRARNAVAELESQRSRSEAAQKRAEAHAADVVLDRLGGERMVRRSERRARLARLEQELAQLEGQRDASLAHARLLQQQLDLRMIRAPIAGRLGAIISLRPGAVVDAGTFVAVVVPEGGLHAVAYFEPAAIGRVRVGQSAHLRLPGFPWTKYGTIAATVQSVGNEPQGGAVRVELSVRRDPNSAIAFEHGVPAEVEVEVERVTPASLLLDAAGRMTTVARASVLAGVDRSQGHEPRISADSSGRPPHE